MNLDQRPVSATLVRDLRGKAQQYGILFWLDKDAHYTELADALARASAAGHALFPGPVLGYRGSYLELMLGLETHGAGLDKTPLLVHLPGATEDTVHEGPLLELYMAGFRVRKALRTAVKEAAVGRVAPEDVEAFLDERGDTLTLREADQWLAARVKVASSELEAALAGIGFGPLIEDLSQHGHIGRQCVDDAAEASVLHTLAIRFGVPEAWLAERVERRDGVDRADQLAFAAARWALCVEFINDLRRSPATAELQAVVERSTPYADDCTKAAAYLRSHQPDWYKTTAIEIEERLEQEKTTGNAGDLGKIDTFRFEEELLYEAALDALIGDRSDEALQWAEERLAGESFWLGQSSERRSAWRLLRAAARLSVAVARCTTRLDTCTSLGEGAEAYAEGRGDKGAGPAPAEVDRLHRQLGQLRSEVMYKELPHFERMRAAVDRANARWEAWAEQLAQGWSTLCEREGLLPNAQFQQRRIFDDVVGPLLSDEVKTAYFLVDALRFEMAQELLGLIGKQHGTAVTLVPRLCELPSVTEVGMNVLPPVVDGTKLQILLEKDGRRVKGFGTARFQVTNVAARKKAISNRAGGSACPWYEIEELLGIDLPTLRHSLKNARLCVVHSIQIDSSGESGAGLSTFDGELHKLRKAWQLLRDAGVRNFVFVADHGFLLRSTGDASGRGTLTHGQGFDAMPRYAIYEHAAPGPDQIGVRLDKLLYSGSDRALLMPRGIGVYQSGKDRDYVHGGNSPQERVIPVLTLRHKSGPGGDTQQYSLKVIDTGQSSPSVFKVVARIEPVGQAGLSFAQAPSILVDLRAADGVGVRSTVMDVGGAATLDGNRVSVEVAKDFELYFRLRGPESGRVRVRLEQGDGRYQVEPVTTPERFDVSVDPGLARHAPVPAPGTDAEAEADDVGLPVSESRSAPPLGASLAGPTGWLASIEDDGFRKVFDQIERYGRVSEQDLIAILGGARKARRFATEFEQLARRAPFKVTIEVTGSDKRYVKK